jgi:hypothetical protein
LASSCTHDAKVYVQVTVQEFLSNQYPLCDFNVTPSGQKHPAVTAARQYFASCQKCHMIICNNCNLESSSLYLLIFN